ncbi:MAG TPA: response regulator transcription factor [Gaiellales bacterium]
MADPIRVLIADDHPVVRQGLRTYLELQADIIIAGEAGGGIEAAAEAKRLAPDVVLLDMVMPEGDGIEALRRIGSGPGSPRVIVLTSFAEDGRVVDAIRAGAAGYLLKDAQPAELLAAIRSAHAGGSPLHPDAAAELVGELRRPPADPDLTAREREVLELLARGMPNKAIALRLSLSEKTVKAHVSAILRKLDVTDRTQAALRAVRERLVDVDR